MRAGAPGDRRHHEHRAVHLELLGTVERVAEAKAEVVAALPAGGTAIAPDEPLLEPYLARDDIRVRCFRPDVLEFEPAGDRARTTESGRARG